MSPGPREVSGDTPILLTAALLAPVATLVLFGLSGRVRRLEVS
ncbi:MAG: hypothetical protein WCR49_00895 [Opitutae bacterium]